MGSTAVEFKNSATSTLLELVKTRRTYYGLKAESPISDDAIESIVQNSVLHVPSSFNTQTSRVVLLLKEEHKKVWDMCLRRCSRTRPSLSWTLSVPLMELYV
jgi:predicted oxidoreductase (fatty acid repression mutant protein)